MKKLLVGTALLLAAGVLPVLSGCSVEEETPRTVAVAAEAGAASASEIPGSEPVSTSELVRVSFAVDGMTCGGCAASTKVVLRRLDGVKDADASYAESTAWALYDPAKVTPERMMAAIRELGYTPTIVESRG